MSLKKAIQQEQAKAKGKSKSTDSKKKDDSPKGNPIKALMLQSKFDALFKAPKNMSEELAFEEQMFTRGTGDGKRWGLHGSAIIASENEFCLRKQVLSLFYEQNDGRDYPINLLRIFEEGNFIHARWQRLFIRGALGKATDMDRTRMSDKFDLSFTPDAILEIDGQKWVGEIKSMNSFSYSGSNGHASGAKQVMLYMHLLGIPRGFVLMDNKNTQEFKVQIVEYDHKFIQPYVERLWEIQECKKEFIEEGILPDRKCKSKTCKEAEQCYMKDACYDIGIGRVELDLKSLKS